MVESAFTQLYQDPKLAAAYSAKADLMIVISHLITQNELSNTRAAEILGTQRSRVSELMNGKIDRISLDTLTAWLNILSEGKLKVSVVHTDLASSAAELVSSLS